MVVSQEEFYKNEDNNNSLSDGNHKDGVDSPCCKNRNNIIHRKQDLFDKIHELKKLNYSQRAIAESLNINRNTVRYYFEMKELLPRTTIYYNNYGDFMNLIKECCDKGLNIKTIFMALKEKGSWVNKHLFYQWFNNHFLEYQSKRKLPALLSSSLTAYDATRFSGMSPNRLAIHLTNSEWGVSKETGECSKSHILAEEIIDSSMLLKDMREAYSSFRDVLNSGDVLRLDQWLEKYKTTNVKRIRSFINDINHDLEAIKNAIKYPWSNGVVEGQIENKKREMYGRVGFELRISCTKYDEEPPYAPTFRSKSIDSIRLQTCQESIILSDNHRYGFHNDKIRGRKQVKKGGAHQIPEHMHPA